MKVKLIGLVNKMTDAQKEETLAFAELLCLREYLRRQRPEFAADFMRLLGECLELLERPE